ncbi:hypothetical protein B0H13DRAFT_2329035 [Mycena leptocephala]|nr:hypothetical protein B0H13DRAFT_2329035 [Mycena leptocephala]
MSGADAAAADARMDRIEATLASLTKILEKQQRAISPALSLAETAPEPGPGLFTQYTTTGGSGAKSVLRPNPPFVFDGDRTQGRAFLHAVRSYARLVPEAFVENGELSEEKVVRYAMSFMAKDAAQRWAERQSAKAEFPFPTWEMFVKGRGPLFRTTTMAGFPTPLGRVCVPANAAHLLRDINIMSGATALPFLQDVLETQNVNPDPDLIFRDVLGLDAGNCDVAGRLVDTTDSHGMSGDTHHVPALLLLFSHLYNARLIDGALWL